MGADRCGETTWIGRVPFGSARVASAAGPRTAKVLRLKSTPRVAVIGAGVIGCTVAWRTRQALGFEVDVYEHRDDILLETTAGTSNRLITATNTA